MQSDHDDVNVAVFAQYLSESETYANLNIYVW